MSPDRSGSAGPLLPRRCSRGPIRTRPASAASRRCAQQDARVTRDPTLLVQTAHCVLREEQGLAHASRFFAAGLDGPDLGRLRHLGVLLRPRIGWYLDPLAPEEAQAAVRVGGVLGCVSAAASWGIVVPSGLGGRVHISVRPDATRLRHSSDSSRQVHAGADPGVRMHWEHRSEAVAGWRVSPADAIAQMAACTTVRWLTAAVDSARNGASAPPVMAASSLPVLRGALPEHLRTAVDRSDAASESSGETFIRLEVEDRRIPIRSQVRLTELYRADHLVDDWLPVESDGLRYHSGSAVARDRGRDAVIAALGMHPLRFTQQMAVEETAFVGDVIERIWRRGRPRGSGRMR